jgi:hypothetical protein
MQAETASQSRVDQIIDRLMSQEDHLSYSSLSAFKRSPKSFIDYKMGIKEETEAMQYGSMFHCLVLEPEDFANRFHVLDDRDICIQIGGAKPRATNAYKAWYATAMQEAGNKTLVETDDFLAAQIAANNVLFNRASSKVLDMASEREKPIEWEFKNFKFKGFKDGDGEKIIFDLKTCADANPKKFQRDIVDKGYYLQAAMYLYAGGEQKDYYIIAVDKKNGVSVHKLEMALIQHGMDEYNDILDKFNHCILKDAWNQSFDFYSDRFDGTFMCEKPAYLY